MKRILAAVLAVFLLISSLTVFCFAAVSITVNPSVFMAGDNYNIVWATTTDVAAVGYVQYTYNGTTYTVYDEENGVVRTDDYIHSVAVPVEHLDAAGSYTVYSRQVSSRSGYSISYSGSAVSKKVSSFRGYTEGDESSATGDGINIFTLSDIHLHTNYKSYMMTAVKNAIAKLTGTEDIIVFNGDNSDDMYTKANIVDFIIDPATQLSNGQIPVIYARGNHETRGEGSVYVRKYFSGDTKELYFAFEYGPLSGIVLDFGEDKVDTHYEYGGLTDYHNYRLQQTEWLDSLSSYKGKGEYKITFCHGPDIVAHFDNSWMAKLHDLGTDLLVSGHSHAFRISYPKGLSATATNVSSDGFRTGSVLGFPVFEEGGHYDFSSTDTVNEVARANRTYRAGQVILLDGNIKCTGYGTTTDGKQIKIQTSESKTYDTDGTTVLTTTPLYSDSFTFKASTTPLSRTTGAAPSATQTVTETADTNAAEEETALPTAYGSSMTTVINSAAPGFAITSKPVVFDTDDTYTIAWTTTSGADSTAEVYVEKDGVIRKYIDHESGSMETETSLHAVKVPKQYLEGGNYKVVSKKVAYRVSHFRYDWTTDGSTKCFGAEVTTGYIDFKSYDGQSEVDMLVIADLNSNYTLTNTFRSKVSGYEMLVLNGNALAKCETESDVSTLVYNIGLLTSGQIPVAFVRGENETTGGYAPYLSDIVGNADYEFYYNVNYGPVNAIVLDTAAVATDSTYNNMVGTGLASFDYIRPMQYEWLLEQDNSDSEYKVVFSRAGNLNNHFGYKYSKFFNVMDTDLAVIGQGETTELLDIGYRCQNYTTLTTGMQGRDGTAALMLNFKDGNITINALNSSAATIKTMTVSTDSNDAVNYSDVSAVAWYSDAVSYVSLQRTMLGTSPTTFAPEENLTRGMAATVLYRLAGVEDESFEAAPFTDVAADKYYTEAVNWAYSEGVINGTSETTYEPDAALTREQLAAMLYRMFGDTIETATDCDFDDFDTVSDYAKEAVASMYNAEIINGMGDDCFQPKTAVTRAMLAQILYKAGF